MRANTSVSYVKGDASNPPTQESSDKDGKPIQHVIIHICNDIGSWGKGFVLSLSARWPGLVTAYKKQSKTLGSALLVQVEPNIIVYNMIAQHGVKSVNNIAPIRYDALKTALESLHIYMRSKEAEFAYRIHGPRLGCGLAGGKWENIEPLLISILCDNGYSVVIYDL